jgi:actin-related protein
MVTTASAAGAAVAAASPDDAASSPLNPTPKKRTRTTPSKTTTTPSKRGTGRKGVRQGRTPPTSRATGTAAGSTRSPNRSASAAPPPPPPPTHVLLIDNGGDTVKYGILGQHETPLSMPNVTAILKHQWTTLVGEEVYAVQPSQIQTRMRSTERGCITNMGNQVQVWKAMLETLRVHVPMLHGDHAAEVFGWKVLAKQPKEKSTYSPSTMAVVLMLPPLCPRTVMDQIMQVWFQDFGFRRVGLVTAQAFGTAPSATGCCTVVDLGWSATQVVPTYQDKILSGPGVPSTPGSTSIRRLPLGGRHLVGLWKYYCSYRQWNLMDADLLLEDVQKTLAYVSLSFKEDLETARRTYLGKRPYDREFVLPDYHTTQKGFVRLTPWLLKLESDKLHQQQQQDADGLKDATNSMEKEKKDPIKEEDTAPLIKIEQPEVDGKENGRTGLNEEEEHDNDVEQEGGADDKENDDEDDEDIDSDNETDDDKRKRLLRQKAEEDRRRRELEAERQVLLVSVERFTIPEVLFHPSDAELGGFAGLPQTICSAIEACPRIYQSALYGNIRLVGGVSKIPNLTERLERELRTLVPTHYALSIEAADDPIQELWKNAKNWLLETSYIEWSVTREEFEAQGSWHRLLNNKLGKLI